MCYNQQQQGNTLMIQVRKSEDRGKTHNSWLNSYHTFSFAEYHDPKFMRFGSLRVINEDRVEAGKGFQLHPHRNMEIISYVIEGALTHHDSMGNGSTIYPGEIQIMSAGKGVEHSEFNHSTTKPLHFLQIWIIPEKQDLAPNYQQMKISKKQDSFLLIASNQKNSNVIQINQDVNIYIAYLNQSTSIDFLLNNRIGWLQLIKGKITLNNQILQAGDGGAIHDHNLHIYCHETAELLVFDLKSRSPSGGAVA